MSSDRRELPARPNLEQYRKQAKELVRARAAGEPAAAARIARWLPGASKGAPSESFLLADAQRVIALEHGYESWPRFRARVETVAAALPFEAGDTIRATQGPFAGMKGEVEEVLIQRSEVRTCLDVRGRPTRVWLGWAHVERL